MTETTNHREPLVVFRPDHRPGSFMDKRDQRPESPASPRRIMEWEAKHGLTVASVSAYVKAATDEALEGSARTLGQIIDRQLDAILDAVDGPLNDDDVIDGDVDWQVVFDHLAELRPRAERAEAQVRAVASVCQSTDGDYLDPEAEIPVGEVLRMLVEAGADLDALRLEVDEDDEEFCPDCYAGILSPEHHQKCIVPERNREEQA